MNRKARLFLPLFFLFSRVFAGLDFSPASSYVAATNTTTLDFTTGNFSISFWASGMNGQVNAIPIGRGTFTVGGWYLFLPNGLQQVWLTTQATGSEQDLIGLVTIPTGWNHWAVVRTGTSTGQWYLNGSPISTSGATQNCTSISHDLDLATYAGSSNFFTGKLDDVAIYNRALSAIEVKSIALSYQRNNNTTGRVYYPPLNDGINRANAAGSNTVLDRSPNAYNGTPTNNPKWDYSSPINYP